MNENTSKISELEQKIAQIERRNCAVELNKTWETSWTRKICIAILTYIVVVIYSFLIKEFNEVWFTSIVPVIGFLLSTMSLGIVRNIWEKRVAKERK